MHQFTENLLYFFVQTRLKFFVIELLNSVNLKKSNTKANTCKNTNEEISEIKHIFEALFNKRPVCLVKITM
jgi:hypothetical protein